MIFNSLVTCDIDARPAMMSNLIVTGGSTLFPGFVDRLYHEVAPKVPGVIDVFEYSLFDPVLYDFI